MKNLKKVYVEILRAVQSEDTDTLDKILSTLKSTDQVYMLRTRSSLIATTIPFYTIMIKPKMFMNLFKHLPESYYVETLSILDDGNTSLTEAISWHHLKPVQTFLNSIQSQEVKEELLNIRNHTGKTTRLLLKEAEESRRNLRDVSLQGLTISEEENKLITSDI